jgi:hypothetical protein
MDDDVIRVITTIIALVGAWKAINDAVGGRWSRIREEYRFAKEFIDDIEVNENIHPFLKEKGYRAIAGDATVDPDDIQYLLSIENPELSLRYYMLGRRYLVLSKYTENVRFVFRKRCQGAFSRGWRKKLYYFLFLVFFVLIPSPMLIPTIMKFSFLQSVAKKSYIQYFSEMSFIQSIVSLTISFIIFGSCAFFFLRWRVKVDFAEELVNSQKVRAKKIPT